MTRRATFFRSTAIALTALLGAASLAACNKSDNATVAQADAGPALPLTISGAEPSSVAPPVDALPAARDVSIVRVEDPEDQYAYLDQAYYQSDAFEDAPPDYAFDYDGVRPWVWRSANDAMEFAEPIGDGYRYYYYQPGAAYPYLVRDNGYAYGYDRGQLAVIYDPSGRPLSADQMAGRRDYAGRYLARADALYRASRSAQRQSVVASNWAAGQARIAAQRAQWSAERSRQEAWRAYDAAHATQQTAYWQDERERRQQSAQAFSQWRRADYQGAPPAPAARQQAFRDSQVRQAQVQVQDEAARRVNADQAQQDRRAADEQARIQADNQRRAEQDRQRQFADQQRQQADQARVQADNRRRDEEGRQQRFADQRRQADDQARIQADNQRRDEQARQQQAQQQRQQADQARVQADNQRKAEQERGRQQAEQQRQQADQARVQADNQRKAEQEQHRQQAEQQRQQQDQARQQAEQQKQQAQAQKQQAQQQAQQDHHAEQQAKKDDKAQSKPAGHDEHREKKDHKDNKDG